MGVVPNDHNPNVLSIHLAQNEKSTKDLKDNSQQLSRSQPPQLKQRRNSDRKEVSPVIEVTWAGAKSSNVHEDLYLCFENKRVSGGGPIEKLTIDDHENVAIIKFKTPAGE